MARVQTLGFKNKKPNTVAIPRYFIFLTEVGLAAVVNEKTLTRLWREPGTELLCYLSNTADLLMDF